MGDDIPDTILPLARTFGVARVGPQFGGSPDPFDTTISIYNQRTGNLDSLTRPNAVYSADLMGNQRKSAHGATYSARDFVSSISDARETPVSADRSPSSGINTRSLLCVGNIALRCCDRIEDAQLLAKAIKRLLNAAVLTKSQAEAVTCLQELATVTAELEHNSLENVVIANEVANRVAGILLSAGWPLDRVPAENVSVRARLAILAFAQHR